MRILDSEHCPPPDEVVAAHVAKPERARGANVPRDRAFVRLNMIASADGSSAVAGVSGGLGNQTDHAVFQALRDGADGVLVGMGTVRAEHYGPPTRPDLPVYVVTSKPGVPDEPLFASGRATLVLPEDAGPVPAGVGELRAGTGGRVALADVVRMLADSVIVAEGGPTLAARLVALGLIDEFFLTVAPRVVAGESPPVIHGEIEADPAPWELVHGFADDDGFLFLRYARTATRSGQSRP